jgi:uncharacterized paraquat-inducible protein A
LQRKGIDETLGSYHAVQCDACEFLVFIMSKAKDKPCVRRQNFCRADGRKGSRKDTAIAAAMFDGSVVVGKTWNLND